MLNAAERIAPARPIGHISAPKHRVDHTHSHVSTIAKSKSVIIPFVPSKPTITPPFWAMIGQVSRLEDAAHKFTVQKEQRIDTIFAEIQRLHRDEGIKLEEAYAASEDMTFWGFLYDVAMGITSSVSFFFGFAAIGSGGTLVGAALITSGVLSLTNIAFKHMEAWDWIATQVSNDKETKQAIKTYLPAAVGITAAAMGAYGAYAAWNYTELQGISKALGILETAAGVAQAVTAWNNGNASERFTSVRAEVSALQTKGELTTLELDIVIEDIKKFQKDLSVIQDLIGRLVQDTSASIQAIQQPV